MVLQNYIRTDDAFWTGRIDDPNDRDSYRMHQVIRLLDLNDPETEVTDPSATHVCFIGFCCDEGIRRNLGRQGAKHGPRYIREEFANLPVTFGDKLKIYDAGDILCEDGNMEDAQKDLESAIEMALNRGLFPIVLGGGHELSLGHYNGILRFLESKTDKDPNLGLISFDAHLDLRPINKEGSSGTMFTQIADICSQKAHEFSYMCLGVQTYSNTLSLFKKADALNVKYILARDFIESGLDDIAEKIDSFVNDRDHIYLTICGDVFSSAFAPGVSAMQPFGMDPETILAFLKQIFKTGKVIGFDIAEVSPRFDHDRHTAKLAAVIIYAIINALNPDN